MIKKPEFQRFCRRPMMAVCLFLSVGTTIYAQQNDNQPKPRDIVPVFEAARPPESAAVPNKLPDKRPPNKTPHPVYSRISQKINSGKVGKIGRPGTTRPPKPSANKPPADIQVAQARQIGITLWKLTPARSQNANAANDDGLISQITGNRTRYLMPTRTSSETLFETGDYVRMAIEAAQRGYLYIVDQELYADGTTGDAYLVYPNKRLRGGAKIMTAGSPVEIPDLTNNPFYFELRPQSDDGKLITAEVLSVIITDAPIAGLKIGDRPLLVSEAMLNGWRTKWAGRAEIFEPQTNGQNGYTKAERLAAGGKGKLTKNDPLPQTVFLVEGNRRGGTLISVPLWYGQE